MISRFTLWLCLGLSLGLPSRVKAAATNAPAPASASASAPAASIAFPVVHPERGTIHRFITLPGTLRANQQATLCAKVAGSLRSITVDKGDPVRAGQTLAEIEVPDLLADRAKFATEVRVAEIEAKRVAAARAKSPDLITPQAVDEAQGRYDIARANLERAETLLGFARIVAPFDGVVTARFVDPGAFVPVATAGATAANGALLTVMDCGTLRALVPVPELEASRVRPGQPVRVTVESQPGRTFAGTVSRHGFALDEATRTLAVEADLPNPPLDLRPGMYATVKIGVERHDDALLVPAGAVVMEKNAAFVFLFATDSHSARKTAVKLGWQDGVRAEVLGGLTGSESVIVAGKTPVADGAPITPTEVAK